MGIAVQGDVRPLRASDQIDALAHQYGSALTRYFKKRISQQSDVEDLVQEVFTRLAGSSSKTEISRPEAYLMCTASNVWKDFLRKRKTHAYSMHDTFEEGQHAYEEDTPEHVLQTRQSIDGLIVALNELPERTRQVFVLYRIKGMKHKDIANRLRVSVSSVEKHMVKAICHLADHLGDIK